MYTPAGNHRMQGSLWPMVGARDNNEVKKENNALKIKAIELKGVYIPSDKTHEGTAFDRSFCRSIRQLRLDESPQKMHVNHFDQREDLPDDKEMRQLQWAIFCHQSVADAFFDSRGLRQISEEELWDKEKAVLQDMAPDLLCALAGSGNRREASFCHVGVQTM